MSSPTPIITKPPTKVARIATTDNGVVIIDGDEEPIATFNHLHHAEAYLKVINGETQDEE